MKQAGQIVLTPFPYTDLSGAKLRPVLMLRQASARFDDWLVCMVSSQTQQAEAGFDELLVPGDPDWISSGLKAPSVLRLSRLAVLDGALMVGCIGSIGEPRLFAVRSRLSAWIAPSATLDALGSMPEDFMADGRDDLPPQERDAL